MKLKPKGGKSPEPTGSHWFWHRKCKRATKAVAEQRDYKILGYDSSVRDEDFWTGSRGN